MLKICLIGAGSTVFAQSILGDVLSNPALQNATISLFDIDETRLSTSYVVANRIGETLGLTNLQVEATMDRRAALQGADFVILMMQVGGYKPATVTDFEVPDSFGLNQTIGDTLGIGGIFRGLRTIPVLFDICRDMEEACPDATLLQYVNPMAINCWAIKEKFPHIKTVGLCHSVQETSHQLAELLGENPADLSYLCAGINHVAFYLKFGKVLPDGEFENLYPRLKAIAQHGPIPDDDRVRFDLLKRVGHFVTESSVHFSEYNSWFLKRGRQDLLEKYNLRLGTALPAAASNGHAPVVRLLLDRQASIGAVDGENERPLHIAALAGQEPVVRLLLDRRASIDATDNFSKQPLYYAVREGHESVVRLLLGQRADPMPLDPTTGPHCTWLPTRATNPSLKCCSIEQLTPQSYQCVTLQPLNATMSYTCSQ